MSGLYSTDDAFKAYTYYLALKHHFNDKGGYDMFKFNKKVNASIRSFETRKDKFYFYKASKIEDYENYMLANILEDQNMWIKDMIDNKEKSESVYKEWVKKQQSLSYVFKTDLGLLEGDLNSNLVSKDGQHPKLLRLYVSNQINIETLIILADLTKVFSHWDQVLVDKILYPDINKKCKKYYPFLNYDKTKMKKIVLDKFK